MRYCVLCGKGTPSDADNVCLECISWFSMRDREDLSKWPAWLRKMEIKRHLDALNSTSDPNV